MWRRASCRIRNLACSAAPFCSEAYRNRKWRNVLDLVVTKKLSAVPRTVALGFLTLIQFCGVVCIRKIVAWGYVWNKIWKKIFSGEFARPYYVLFSVTRMFINVMLNNKKNMPIYILKMVCINIWYGLKPYWLRTFMLIDIQAIKWWLDWSLCIIYI